MNSELGPRRALIALVFACAVPFFGCGGDSKSHGELPAPMQSTPPSYLGTACGAVMPVIAHEVDIEVMAPDCGGVGECFHGPDVAAGAASSAGMCTCRCDGPADSGPFCDCGEDFACRDEVVPLGSSESDQYAGSYCVLKE